MLRIVKVKTSKQTQPETRLLIALSVAIVMSWPVLQQTHIHPGDQLLAVDCEICLQLSAANNLLSEHFINQSPAATWQFNVYQYDAAAHSILHKQQARAPLLSEKT